MRMKVSIIGILISLVAWSPCKAAGAGPETEPSSPAQTEARTKFRERAFGMFIHWGIYSQLGDGEWVLNNHKIPLPEYEKLAGTFRPDRFRAEEWVELAREAGMRYITVTAKHHDGFGLFDSKLTDWDIAGRSAFKRDVMKELADACHAREVPLFFYYSHLDWHHPDYFPLGRTGRNTGRAEAGDWDRYLDFVDAQLTELLTGYGPVAGIWFDGWWDKPAADWRLTRTYDLIHRLRPSALIGNNHHRRPFPGEDIQMFEKDLPGQNASGLNAENAIGRLPLESCETINRAWGYNTSDRTFKTPTALIQTLVRAAGADANLLLNVGPRPDGTIQPECVDRLKAVGAWLRGHGRSIYGTRGGPIAPQPWGVTTHRERDGLVFVHLLDRSAAGRDLVLKGLGSPPRFARTWEGQPVGLKTVPGGVSLELADVPTDATDAIIELEMPHAPQ